MNQSIERVSSEIVRKIISIFTMYKKKIQWNSINQLLLFYFVVQQMNTGNGCSRSNPHTYRNLFTSFFFVNFFQHFSTSLSFPQQPFKMMRTIFAVLVVGVTMVLAQRRLALPDPRSCANRVRHATYRDARGVAHSYFFSWEHAPTSKLEVDWLDSRNICRRHCMDAVSLETPQVGLKLFLKNIFFSTLIDYVLFM